MSGSGGRPVPRWVHAWAVLTVAVAACLLLLGGLVTTFRVGMADPVWPTEPWYLFFISWREPSSGFLIEHTHRLAGFTVGGLMSVLALAVWWGEPGRQRRRGGALLLVALLAAFGQFHRQMGELQAAGRAGWPVATSAAMLLAVAALAVALAAAARERAPGWRLRLLAVAALLGVMIQGLLGGFRVRFNELAGTDLALFHGVFAQVVFALLVALAVLTAAHPRREIPAEEGRRLQRLSVLLVALVFLQQIWGAMIRHDPTPLAQRLHLLTAFAVVAAGVWLIRFVANTPPLRPRAITATRFLAGLLAVQVMLGVEAWLGKFGTGVLPELQRVTAGVAAVRTGHMFVGAWVLAAAVVLAVKAFRPVYAPARAGAESAGAGGSRPAPEAQPLGERA
ncbi:MAG TPA: hypothetical protein VIL46_04420 [Gemmataceae bacterium]